MKNSITDLSSACSAIKREGPLPENSSAPPRCFRVEGAAMLLASVFSVNRPSEFSWLRINNYRRKLP